MQAQVTDRAHLVEAGCAHLWRRARQLEEELSTVVYVRSCARCGQVEAKAGHKNPVDSQGWELIEA